ncbi:MAG: hypothetical protein V2A54_05380 [Bacteroidota bacterium]
MFKTDLFAKRFLLVCAGVSMVVLSVAFLIRSTQNAQANAPAVAPSGKTASYGSGVEIYPMGISNGTAYWLEYVDSWHFNSKALAEWK